MSKVATNSDINIMKLKCNLHCQFVTSIIFILADFIYRFDHMTEKTNDTKKAVDALWKAYQFTDELAPLMEWIEESISKSTREINTNSASQTEELQEKQEKVLDQIDKKRKTYTESKTKGEKLMTDPKAPKFLQSHIDKLNEMWKQANNEAENRLKQLKGMYVVLRCMSGCQLAITSINHLSISNASMF